MALFGVTNKKKPEQMSPMKKEKQKRIYAEAILDNLKTFKQAKQ